MRLCRLGKARTVLSLLSQMKTPNLIFNKLGVDFVAHSGIEPLFPE